MRCQGTARSHDCPAQSMSPGVELQLPEPELLVWGCPSACVLLGPQGFYLSRFQSKDESRRQEQLGDVGGKANCFLCTETPSGTCQHGKEWFLCPTTRQAGFLKPLLGCWRRVLNPVNRCSSLLFWGSKIQGQSTCRPVLTQK